MRLNLIILVLYFASCKGQELSFNIGTYTSKGDDIKYELTFNRNNTFHYITSSPNFEIKEVYGKWNIEDSIITLNSYINKETPRISCEKNTVVRYADSVSFDFLYVDSSKVIGDVILESDTNIIQILALNRKLIIKRNDSITSLIIEAPFVTLLKLPLNLKKYNSYKCFIKPDRYPSFNNMRFKVEPSRIVNVKNKADYYTLKK